jgi:hypothetical protein
VTLILNSNDGPQAKSSDAGNSDMAMRSHKLLLLGVKVKVFSKERKTNCMLRLPRSMARMNLLTRKL